MNKNDSEVAGCMDRRMNIRHPARTTVYLSRPGERGRLLKTTNISAAGVFVETKDMGLSKGSIVELAFAVNMGQITKLHRRTGIVAHVSHGGTGLVMTDLPRRRSRTGS